MKVVHLPCYPVNPYQRLLFEALRKQGITPIDGGSGGNFLRSILFRWQPEAVHFHWLHPYVMTKTQIGSVIRFMRFVLETMLIRLCGCRLIWTVHNLSNHSKKHPTIDFLANYWMTYIANGIICHSQYAANELQRIYGVSQARCSVSFHPNYLPLYDQSIWPSKQEARLTLDLPEDSQTVFLFFGRVAPYKGIEQLITSFRSFAEASAKLVIAGSPIDKEYTDSLTELAGEDERIHFLLRHIEDAELATLFAAVDVAVFPFRSILTSGSLILAMGFGKACIVPHLPSMAEVLPISQEPLTYPPDQVLGLYNQIAFAVQNPDLISSIGRANREQVANWTWEAMASTCRSLYTNCENENQI